MEGAGGENDLSFGTKGLRAAIGRTHHAPRAAALQQDFPDDGVRADAEIGPRPRGIDERVRGARALAPVDVPVEGAEPFLLITVDVMRHGKARRGARFDEGPAERIFNSEANRGQRTAAAAPGVFAPAVAFAAPEVRQDFGIGPTDRAFLGPTLVVEGMAPDVGHAVDRGRPAEPLAARLKDAPTCEMPLMRVSFWHTPYTGARRSADITASASGTVLLTTARASGIAADRSNAAEASVPRGR